MHRERIDLDALLAATMVEAAEHHDVLDSTNRRAAALAACRGVVVPRLIVADRQTAGRGRAGRSWWTGPGALAFSLLLDLRPIAPTPAQAVAVSLAAGIAVCEAVRPRVSPATRLGLHWPNDVFADGRKLAGILIEAPPGGRHVVGIGLNVNNRAADAPGELANRVATLCDLTGRTFSRTEVLIDVLRQFEIQLQHLATAPLQLGEEAQRLCLQVGQTLRLESGGAVVEGVCRGMAADGALVLDTPNGPRTFYSGSLQ